MEPLIAAQQESKRQRISSVDRTRTFAAGLMKIRIVNIRRAAASTD